MEEPSEIDKILNRYRENQAYSNGLIKSETATGHVFTKAEISHSRQMAREFIEKHITPKKG